MRVPLVEHAELFQRSIGEHTDIVEKEMYSFEDRGGDRLSLRPEATAGLVRAAIEHGLLHNQKQRLWTAGPMFRHERPQAGRYRQFHQIDCEAFGYPGPDIDAEVIQVSARLWRKLGLEGLRLSVNSLGTPESRRRYRAVLVDYLSSRQEALDADSLRRLESNPLRILDSKNPALREVVEGAPRLLDHLDDESRRHFDRFLELLAASGIAADVDPRLVRGLDYYTRTVFEWRTTALGAQDAVCSGGRYDGLVEQLGGEPTPAIGWALGIERIVALMQAAGIAATEATPAVYLVLSGERAERAGLALAERLRDALPGRGVLANMEGGSFKAQMKRADRSGASVALIVGDDEAARGVAAVKSLRDRGRSSRNGAGTSCRSGSPRRWARARRQERTMVDEYLSEREQAEQLRRWLRENWIWLVAGVVLTVGGYYGYRWWESRQATRAVDAGQRFAAMLDAIGANRRDEGLRIAGELTGDYADTPYADQATLVLARLDVDAGDFAAAEKRLAGVAGASKDPDLRVVARLRLARVQLAQGRYDDALKSLDAVATPSVDARVLELRGDVLLAQGDAAAALAEWTKAKDAAAADPAAGAQVDTELLQLKIDELGAAGPTE